MASMFALLADPVRRRILAELRGSERSVGELVTLLQMKQPAVSKQLRVLRDAGLAQVRVDGQRRMYSLRADGLREIDDWIAPFRVCWSERFDAMEDLLDSMEDA